MKWPRFEELQEMLVIALKYDELYRDIRDVKIEMITSPFGPPRVIYEKWSKLPRYQAILPKLMYPIYVAYFIVLLLVLLLLPVPLIMLIFFLFVFFIVVNLTFDPRIRGS